MNALRWPPNYRRSLIEPRANAEVEAILRETAHALEFEGDTAPRASDAGAAVNRVKVLK